MILIKVFPVRVFAKVERMQASWRAAQGKEEARRAVDRIAGKTGG